MKKNIGIYVHIPFCKAKCYYCDFISYANKENIIEAYINALLKEIKYRDLEKYNIDTIYIGGGTPSILDSKYIKEILEKITPKKNAEITIEINPGTCNKEKLKEYKKIGINRLSIGLQSTDNKLLAEIGRIHTYEEFLRVYNQAREIGFSNINVDLMLGLPNQTLEILEKSVKTVVRLKPEHISIYSLILEEGTKLYNMVNEGKVKLTSEELERKMYWGIKHILEKNGYIHYEISNFAKKGYKSRHNSDCWEQKEYIGLGVAAHSYLDNKRYSNTESIENYIKNINSAEFDKNITIHEIQTKEDKQNEYMILGLRKIEGVDIREFANKFKENPMKLYKNELDKLIKEELVEINKNKIRLSNKGLDLANLVFEEFI